MNEKNEELAEFLGILLGDGNLNKSSNCITIVGSLEEDSYYRFHVMPLIKRLFQISPKLRNRNDRNAIYIDFNSKEIMDYLTNSIGLVRGNKINAKIPNLIKNDVSLIPSFLRGLFDTDGCFKFSKQGSQKNYYPRIQFCFSDTPFAHEVGDLLKKTGFNFGVWKDARFNGLLFYQISGSYNLEKWMKVVGSNNPVQKTKYQVWRKYGSYTPKSSLKSRIDSLNLNMEV